MNVMRGATVIAGASLAALAWRKLRAPRWKGKVAIVTGGSRGLGLLLAEGLRARGLKLVLVARDVDELKEARRLLVERGAEVLLVAADLVDPHSAEIIVSAALARFGRIDVLVNDAGVIQVGPQKSMSLEDYERAMQVNFFAAVRLTKACVPHLEDTRGRILDITSIGGALPVPHLLPYAASKFAFVGWSAGMAAELANNGIRVVTVLPWLMRTGSFVHAEVKGQREKEARNFALSSSLPFLTLSGERAAKRILRALDRGERFVCIGVMAKAARLVFALAPAKTIGLLGLVNRLLPHMQPGAAGPHEISEPVWMHRRGLARSFLTRLGDSAARRNNELISVPP